MNYTKQIEKLLDNNPAGLSLQELATQLDLASSDAEAYLQTLIGEGTVKVREVGSAKIYIKSKHLPFAQQLQLFEQAMNKASCGITVADANKPDMPLMYINDSFIAMTGYTKSEVLGKNCRFLQGDADNTEARKQIRSAFERKASVTVVMKNFKKDGTMFYNELHIAPLSATGEEITHFVGIQTDVSYRYMKDEALASKE
jgi:PAS domain S-box-containing protein